MPRHEGGGGEEGKDGYRSTGKGAQLDIKEGFIGWLGI